MRGWLIVNARLVNEGRVIETDLRIRRGRIDCIGAGLASRHGETIVDARGRFLIPGMIDTLVNFREPGLTRNGSIATESRAAVAGGITSYLDSPDSSPATRTRLALADKFSRAAGRSAANYSFYLGAGNDNLSEIQALTAGEACGIKVFISDGRPGFDDRQRLEQLFEQCQTLIAAHCEDRASIEITLETASRHNTRLHLLHLSTANEVELLEPGTVEDKTVSAGVGIQHLYFIDADYEELGNRLKTSPSIKSAEDRAVLRRALKSSHLDMIATDHSPHLLREKGGKYERAAAGLPLVQFALPAAWSLIAARSLTPEQLVEKIAHNPARLFRIADRGFAREGYWADLVMIDARQRTDVDQQAMLSQCAWTPFAGRKLPARVCATWVNGQLVWRDGLLTGIMPGARLEVG